MAITINAKGTSSPHFTIGKKGVTLYQGTADPVSKYSVKSGDYWFDSQSGTIKFYENGNWSSGAVDNLELNDLLDVVTNNAEEGDYLKYDGTEWVSDPSTEKYRIAQNGNTLIVNVRYYVMDSATIYLPNVENTVLGDTITISCNFSTAPILRPFGAQAIMVEDQVNRSSVALDYDQEINIVSDGVKWILLADQVITGGTF